MQIAMCLASPTNLVLCLLCLGCLDRENEGCDQREGVGFSLSLFLTLERVYQIVCFHVCVFLASVDSTLSACDRHTQYLRVCVRFFFVSIARALCNRLATKVRQPFNSIKKHKLTHHAFLSAGGDPLIDKGSSNEAHAA